MRVPRPLFAPILAALVGLGGPAVTTVRADTLADLLGPNGATLTSGDLTFSNFTYQPPAGPPDPTNVTVTAITDSSGFAGIQIGGGFGQTDVGTSDFRIGYTVTDNNAGARITDVHMDGNPALTPATADGTAIVTESVYDPNSPSNANPIAFGQINATMPPGSQTTTINLPSAYASLNITKDIYLQIVSEVSGTHDSASISFLNQTFSTTVVPEPTSFVMMGLGVGIGGLVLRRRMAVKV